MLLGVVLGSYGGRPFGVFVRFCNFCWWEEQGSKVGVITISICLGTTSTGVCSPTVDTCLHLSYLAITQFWSHSPAYFLFIFFSNALLSTQDLDMSVTNLIIDLYIFYTKLTKNVKKIKNKYFSMFLFRKKVYFDY